MTTEAPGRPPFESSDDEPRPDSVTAAGVIGIALGVLSIVFNVLQVTVIGTLFEVDAFLALMVAVGVIVGLLLVVGGIEAMQGGSPRRLLLGSYASIALTLLDQLRYLSDGVFVPGLVSLILPAVIVYLLSRPSAREYHSRIAAF